jgi:spermidine synthase
MEFEGSPAIIRPAMTEPYHAPLPPTISGTAAPSVVFPTAFLEGAAVIIIEIAGARALAPFFGTSLQVWTAQITVTLFFLALGYGLGGVIAKRIGPWTLPALFGVAGFWTALYPLLRTPVLESTSKAGVAIGSLLSASILFGVPLLMLGSVSPVLIAYIDRRRPGAGTAAGRLFFTNTMGGLIGGWVTAFVLIPHSSLRIALVATGVGLILLALIWSFIARTGFAAAVIPMLLIAGYILFFNHPQPTFHDKYKVPFELRFSHQSGIGLLQVLNMQGIQRQARILLINGVIQGEMDVATGRATMVPERLDYIHQLHLLSYSHHENAKTALQLGLGAGLMPKELSRRGIDVTAVEIEPRIVELARRHFNLPETVHVVLSDARTFLRRDSAKYDLVFLDTFASESTAWYLLTREAMAEMKQRLNPGGRLVINTVAYARGERPGLGRMESAVLSAFPEAMVYPEKPATEDPGELINITLVAGEKLNAQMKLPSDDYRMTMLARIIADGRPATSQAPLPTDDRSDLDYAEAAMRIRWRTLIWNSVNSDLLWD